MQVITLTTHDGINLEALWWDAKASRSIILLHMMPATKESWAELAEQLKALSWNVLAPDLRGHGNSSGGDYKTFVAEDHQKYIRDLEAAVEYIDIKYPNSLRALGGASIGANIALQYMSEHYAVSKGFMLSPGLDYHGVKAIDFVARLHETQSILLIGSHDDGRSGDLDNGKQVEELFAAATSQKDKAIFGTGGHGTSLFTSHPDLPGRIITFLNS